jgi:Xaa-Pro dipeptidase
VPAELHFSLDEFAARLAALRQRMVAAGIDVLLLTTPENIYYLSGYQTPGYYFYLALVVPVDGEPVLIPPPHEESLVDVLSIFPTYRLYRDTNDWIALTRDVLVELGTERGRVGVENGSWFLTSRDYLRLAAMLGEARLVDGSGLVEQGRMIKSARELEYMRAAARAAQAGVAEGLGAIRAGATEAEVAIAIHRGQLAAGSEYPAMPRS